MRYYLKVRGRPISQARRDLIRTVGEKVVEAGKEISKKNVSSSVLWDQKIPMPNFNQVVTFCIPFDWALSKNQRVNLGQGRFYVNTYTRQAEEVIVWKIRSFREKWVQSKLYLDLFIEKPNHRGDALNFLDTIADAVVKGTGVDDHWFSVGRIDWQINKNDPKIWITLKQDTLMPLQACSHCGRILPFSSFDRNRTTKSGYGRVCSDCRHLGWKLARNERDKQRTKDVAHCEVEVNEL